MGIKQIHIIVLFLFLSAACSSSKWVVENQFEIDRNDFELLDSRQFLKRAGTVRPDNPIVQFEVMTVNTFEYTQRVRTDRYIQRYRPSFTTALLGIAGAGLTAATASSINTDKSKSNYNQLKLTQNILYGTAGLISFASLLNMNPNGDPNPTGEVRLLRKTGTIIETDTVTAQPFNNTDVSYTIYFEGDILAFGNNLEYRNGRFTINLLESFNPEQTDYESDDIITLEIYFNDDIYVNSIPVNSFLEQFVVISSDITALRDEPILDSRTILTDLAQGSQLKYVDEIDNWYKVLYGISETYIAKTDANLIWRPSEFATQLSIITVPNIPFGNIDVESDIPEHAERTENAYAFIVANREYQDGLSERIYAERDAELISTYLNEAFGYRNDNIQTSTNVENQQQLVLAYNRLVNSIRNQQEKLVVYVSGYVTSGDNGQVELIGTGGSVSSPINLNSFFSGISRLPVTELVVLLDIDNIDENDTEIIEPLANQILENNPNSAILVSSTESQRSRNYSSTSGDQKRHSIFTYFVADAIKVGATDVSYILNHLQRNVDYTSRRLHNQPQHILFYGNSDIRFID